VSTVQTTTTGNSVLSALLQQQAANAASGSSSSSGTGTAGSNSATGMQNSFMTLLVTQMKNQDPLNPMDNSQMTSQLAQINTVSGIDQLNTTVQSLMSNLGQTQTIQAAAMVGHGVLVPGSTISSDGTNTSGFGVDLPQAVDSLNVQIKDSNGRLVRTLTLGAQSAGVSTFSWDGKADSGAAAAAGQYSFSVAATQGGSKIDATALDIAQVSSVSNGTQGIRLNLGTAGTVSLSDVRQII